MKKLFAILAIAAVMVSCGNKKKDEKKPEGDNTTTTTTESTTTPSIAGVPTFSDPEVQKFATDYAAFLAEYKAGLKDPAKLEAMSKDLEQWQGRGQEIGLKLAANPEEAQKWAAWWMAILKDIMPEMPDMPKTPE